MVGKKLNQILGRSVVEVNNEDRFTNEEIGELEGYTLSEFIDYYMTVIMALQNIIEERPELGKENWITVFNMMFNGEIELD